MPTTKQAYTQLVKASADARKVVLAARRDWLQARSCVLAALSRRLLPLNVSVYGAAFSEKCAAADVQQCTALGRDSRSCMVNIVLMLTSYHRRSGVVYDFVRDCLFVCQRNK